MTTYKGLRTAVEYAKKCPRGYYVKFFARETNTGFEIETSRYLNEDHVSIYPRIYGGWTEINRIADHMVGLKPHTTTDLEVILDHIIIKEAKRREVTDDYFNDEVRMRSIKLSDKAEEALNEILNYHYGKDRDHTIDYGSSYFEKMVKFDHMELTAMLERVEKAKEEQARKREEESE